MSKYAEEILAAVTELQRHPTAEQVFMAMKKDHPSIALGTVYKHLNALAEEGLLHRIERALGRDILAYDLRIRYICPDCREIEKTMLKEAPDERKGIKAAQRADQQGALLRLFESGLYQPLRLCWIRRIRKPVSHTGA